MLEFCACKSCLDPGVIHDPIDGCREITIHAKKSALKSVECTIDTLSMTMKITNMNTNAYHHFFMWKSRIIIDNYMAISYWQSPPKQGALSAF